MDNTSDNLTKEVGASQSGAGTKRHIPIENDFYKRRSIRLYLQEETADVHFIFNRDDGAEQRIPAHKVMLASGSPVFHSMFYGDLKENESVCITDCRFESFKEFLQFFYLSDVTLTMDNVAEVMNMVNKYDATECFKTCEYFLLQNFSMQNACWALELANLFNLIEFQHSLLKRIMVAPNEFFATDSFKNCTRDTLKTIISCEQANCDEKWFFLACMDWAANACMEKELDPLDMVNIREQLGDCLYLIRFAAMSHTDVYECVSKWGDLFSKDELVDIIGGMASDDHIKLKYFPHKMKRLECSESRRANVIKLTSSAGKMYDEELLSMEKYVFKINKKTTLIALTTNSIVCDTINVAKTITGVMKIRMFTDPRNLHTQPFSLDIATSGAHSSFSLIRLSEPVDLEPNQQYHLKFEFAPSNVRLITKKNNSVRSISGRGFTVSGVFGFVSSFFFKFS